MAGKEFDDAHVQQQGGSRGHGDVAREVQVIEDGGEIRQPGAGRARVNSVPPSRVAPFSTRELTSLLTRTAPFPLMRT